MKKIIVGVCASLFVFQVPMCIAEEAQKSGYSHEFVDLVEFIYGEGLLEFGGNESIDEMFHGIALDDKKILDLGSGLGGVDLYLAQHYTVDITAVDPEAWLIVSATERLRTAQDSLKGAVKFEVLNTCPELPYADASFDIVMSRGALLHVPHDLKQAYFAEMLRVLKPGGKLVVDDWMHTSPDYSPDVIRMMTEDGVVFNLITPSEYELVLKGAGFSDINIRDTTALAAQRTYAAVDHIVSHQDEIQRRFGNDVYEYSVRGWNIQAQAFVARELLTGVVTAIRR